MVLNNVQWLETRICQQGLSVNVEIPTDKIVLQDWFQPFHPINENEGRTNTYLVRELDTFTLGGSTQGLKLKL
jgi:hypothetical protein